MEVAEHIAALDAGGRRFAEVIAGVSLDVPVPPCPGWDVRELARHLGGIHRWATRYVSEARTEVIDLGLEELVGGWPDDSDLVGWFAAGHRKLVDALVAAPEDLDCFTFLEASSPRAMWARRQAHETSIHRVDAESAIGALTPFSEEIAIDGIDEMLTAFITRRRRGPRAPTEQSIQFAPEDDPARWTVRFDSASCSTERAAAAADAIVSGTASDLYAWAWNRPTIGVVVVGGDSAVAKLWRETVHVRWG